MERVCFLARVWPDRLDEYRERHKNVWPEMRAALAEASVGLDSALPAADANRDRGRFLGIAGHDPP